MWSLPFRLPPFLTLMCLEQKVNSFVAVDGCGVFRRVIGVCVALCLLLICLVVRVHLLLALHGSHPTLEPAVNTKCYCESDPSLTLMEEMLNICGVDTDGWLFFQLAEQQQGSVCGM